ncbi:hypothetical protein WR25_14874 isoform B [Diploscapter pachys]|uniref:RRM domain-containing protein n=1 Tax=Diploscapter pachys TaxID=2018661 RepID=A0A2A2LV03_9BILA|nr:hypothetical protein WR25_14874 isoform B [Diploscapter pachys]
MMTTAAANQLGQLSQLGQLGVGPSFSAAGLSHPTAATSPLCPSTPLTYLQQQQPQLLQLLPSTPGLLTPYEMQLQQSAQSAQLCGGSSFEGMPIFLLPQNNFGQPSAISLAALQRAAAAMATVAPAEPKIDTSKHHHVFVGDLSPEVDNRMLKEAFQVHGEVSEAKIIRDATTQKSKGYGFVSFPVKEHAEKALEAMQGQWIGKRAIRTNWATRRSAEEARDKLTFEQVFNSTKADNTSVYVGNINPITTENDLREPFSAFGEVTEVRLFKSQGYGFVRFEKKECATNAIMEMNGKEICGNTIRASWGRVQQSVG